MLRLGLARALQPDHPLGLDCQKYGRTQREWCIGCWFLGCLRNRSEALHSIIIVLLFSCFVFVGQNTSTKMDSVSRKAAQATKKAHSKSKKGLNKREARRFNGVLSEALFLNSGV